MATEAGLIQILGACAVYFIGFSFGFMLFFTYFLYFVISALKIVFSAQIPCFFFFFRIAENWGL